MMMLGPRLRFFLGPKGPLRALRQMRPRRRAEAHLENFANPVETFPGAAGFLASQAGATSGSWRIAVGDVWLDLEFTHRGSRDLLVVFGGARNPRALQTVPFFSGRAFGEACCVSTLMIADPALYRDRTLQLGWYAGASGVELSDLIPAAINHVRANMGGRRALLMGGSGGGFAALQYAPAVPHCLAVVWNPQIKIAEYTPPARRDYAWSAWGVREGKADAFLADDPRFEVTGRGSRHRTIYLQNVNDRLHVRRHMPFFFLRMLKGLDLKRPLSQPIGKLGYLHLDDFGYGHHPPSKVRLLRLVKHFLRPDCDWRTDLRTEVILPLVGFTRDLPMAERPPPPPPGAKARAVEMEPSDGD